MIYRLFDLFEDQKENDVDLGEKQKLEAKESNRKERIQPNKKSTMMTNTINCLLKTAITILFSIVTHLF